MNKRLNQLIHKVLKSDERLWNEDKTELNQTLLLDLVENIDEKVIDLLLQEKDLREKFFIKIKDSYVFKTNDFKSFIEENKIGVTANRKQLIQDTNDDVLEGKNSTKSTKERTFFWISFWIIIWIMIIFFLSRFSDNVSKPKIPEIKESFETESVCDEKCIQSKQNLKQQQLEKFKKIQKAYIDRFGVDISTLPAEKRRELRDKDQLKNTQEDVSISKDIIKQKIPREFLNNPNNQTKIEYYSKQFQKEFSRILYEQYKEGNNKYQYKNFNDYYQRCILEYADSENIENDAVSKIRDDIQKRDAYNLKIYKYHNKSKHGFFYKIFHTEDNLDSYLVDFGSYFKIVKIRPEDIPFIKKEFEKKKSEKRSALKAAQIAKEIILD